MDQKKQFSKQVDAMVRAIFDNAQEAQLKPSVVMTALFVSVCMLIDKFAEEKKAKQKELEKAIKTLTMIASIIFEC